MNKRGQGISINTIIIAVIALVVLVVLVAIFTGRLAIFSKGVSETTTCDQLCKARGYDEGTPGTGDKGETTPGGFDDENVHTKDSQELILKGLWRSYLFFEIFDNVIPRKMLN